MTLAHTSTKPDYESYFSDPALIKAYYIPTEKLQLTNDQKKMAMSPQRIPERESGVKQPITPETEAYLRQAEYMYNTEKGMPNHPTPSPPSTVKFDESWPSTEHPSTLGSNVTKLSNGVENHSPSTDDSVISKYLRRFRNDPPLRREERKVPSLHEFWWGPSGGYASRAGSSFAPKPDKSSSSRSTGSSARATENTNSDRDFEVSSDTTPRSHSSGSKSGKRIHFEATTPKTKALLDRTNQLLSNSELTGTSSSPPTMSAEHQVSSDELSGSHGGIYHSTPEEEAVRPVIHRNLSAVAHRPVDHQPAHRPAGSLNPDNDILYQWRLKRRLEQAQERVKAAEQQAASSQSGIHHFSSMSAAQMPRPITRSTMSAAAIPPPAPAAPSQEVGLQGAAGDTGTVRSVKTTVVERVIQTDAEIVQTGTQTTPTVDPISACTGAVADIQTSSLRDRISAASPTKSCTHCCHNCDTTATRRECCQKGNSRQCCQTFTDCSRRASDRQQLTQRKLCVGCSRPMQLSNANNNCLAEQPSSDEESICGRVNTTDSCTPTISRRRAAKAPPIPTSGMTVEPKSTHGTTPISKVISEVCRQRLFDCSSTPDVTLMSPVSRSPVAVSSHADSEGRTARDQCSDSSSSVREHSDGEYSDDELLAALREKRQQMMESMRQLDVRLREIASEPL